MLHTAHLDLDLLLYCSAARAGVHPHLQRVQQDASNNEVLTALPDPDPSRPHIFMDITVDNKPAGGRLTTCQHKRGGLRDATALVSGSSCDHWLTAGKQPRPAALNDESMVCTQYTRQTVATDCWPLFRCPHATGRVVIELFDDVAPAAARHLLTRCTPGSAASVQGTLFHKLFAGFALFGGKR